MDGWLGIRGLLSTWAEPNEPLERLASQLELGSFCLRAGEEARLGSKIYEPSRAVPSRESSREPRAIFPALTGRLR